jgi:acyl carrier protein
MKKSEFLSEIAEILGVSAAEVSEKTSLQELGWDSLANVSFLGFADEKFDLAVSPKAIAECVYVEDLMGLVQQSIEG